MKNCINCLYRQKCAQCIAFINDYGMITKKELTLCSEYDKDISVKDDLSDFYNFVFNFDFVNVQKIIREEYVGFKQMLVKTKLTIICEDNSLFVAVEELKRKIWYYFQENNLVVTYEILEEHQVADRLNNNYYEDLDAEIIERESFYDEKN